MTMQEHGEDRSALLPASALWEIRATASSGRAIFATQDIPRGTVLLRADKTSIVVILREYRREVCAQCFFYERGRNLKVRDAPSNFSFCTLQCYEEWRLSMSDIHREAWTVLETFIKSKAGKGNLGTVDGAVDPTDSEGDITMGDFPRHPLPDDIATAWSSARSCADSIRAVRMGDISKHKRRASQTATSVVAHADSLYFLLAGILLHHTCSGLASVVQPDMWAAHVALAGAETPYMSSAQLRRHVYGYLQLLTILPTALLASVTPEVCQQTIKHDVHNAFGIRSLDDAGSEFFGWAVWPHASFFNHSCACNIAKERKDRTWSFWTLVDVKKGEELTISYLGGDEHDLTGDERGKRTESIWGFVCACARCNAEKLRCAQAESS